MRAALKHASQDRTKRCLIERGADEKRVKLYYEGMVVPTGLLMDTHAKGKQLVHMDIGYLEVIETPPQKSPPARRGGTNATGAVPVRLA